MDTDHRRRVPASTERQFQTLRDRFIARDRDAALRAEAEWDRLTHQADAWPRPVATALARSRRRIGNALIPTGRRLDGTSNPDASQDLALGRGGAPS